MTFSRSSRHAPSPSISSARPTEPWARPASAAERSLSIPRLSSTAAHSSTLKSWKRTRWQREMMVGSSAEGASVIRKNSASPEGLSSVLSNAFWAGGVMASACSMSTTCLTPS